MPRRRGPRDVCSTTELCPQSPSRIPEMRCHIGRQAGGPSTSMRRQRTSSVPGREAPPQQRVSDDCCNREMHRCRRGRAPSCPLLLRFLRSRKWHASCCNRESTDLTWPTRVVAGASTGAGQTKPGFWGPFNEALSPRTAPLSLPRPGCQIGIPPGWAHPAGGDSFCKALSSGPTQNEADRGRFDPLNTLVAVRPRDRLQGRLGERGVEAPRPLPLRPEQPTHQPTNPTNPNNQPEVRLALRLSRRLRIYALLLLAPAALFLLLRG
jgi:hypothetical protein